MWLRVSKTAIEKGFKFEHIGRILHGKLHQDFGAIVDKIQVKIYTEEARVKEVIDMAKDVYIARDERLGSMTDESEEIFYSCTLCQSFAPSHVCVITPERVGMCGAYNWLDGKASYEINPTGPNQPITKGDLIDTDLGQWIGVNEFVKKASRGKVERVSAYSLMVDPMTACGCFECVATMLPTCNGIMIVNRDYMGMTPSGMKFSTTAGMVGGGQVTPGFLGISKHYICSRKFMKAEGGLKRVVWMPKILKEELRDRLQERAEEENAPNLVEMIADDEVGITEDEVLSYIKEKKHPALSMEKVM